MEALCSNAATVDVIGLEGFVHEILVGSGRWKHIWLTSLYFTNIALFIILVPHNVGGHQRVSVSFRFEIDVGHVSVVHLVENLLGGAHAWSRSMSLSCLSSFYICYI